MNLILIGLGPHAKRIYIKLMKKHNIMPKLIVDLESEKGKIKKFLSDQQIEKVTIYLVPDDERNNTVLYETVQNELSDIINQNKITHAIISTEPKANLAYAIFLLETLIFK